MIFVEPVSARIGGGGGGNVACFDRLPNDLENAFSMYPCFAFIYRSKNEKRNEIEIAKDNRGRDLIKTAIRLYYRITLQLRITNTRGNKLQRLA